jgi:1,4-alpha-glucan branching enzyme
VDAPGARRVWLRADATAWRAVELARDPGGGWSAALPLASGTHRVLVRVDDGPWRAPANLPAVDDDMGGRVGLLVVP